MPTLLLLCKTWEFKDSLFTVFSVTLWFFSAPNLGKSPVGMKEKKQNLQKILY
jgi:hypothetical protein